MVEQGAGSHVTLSWLSPLNDGGSMVTEYLVEKKDAVGDKWIKVATTRSDMVALLHYIATQQALFLLQQII